MAAVKVCNSEEVVEGAALSVTAGGHKLLLTRVNGAVQAISARCPHLGMPLARGKIADGAITCPWHGSRYDVCTGRNLDWVNSFAGIPMPAWSHKLIGLGRQPAPIDTFVAEDKEGAVFVTIG